MLRLVRWQVLPMWHWVHRPVCKGLAGHPWRAPLARAAAQSTGGGPHPSPPSGHLGSKGRRAAFLRHPFPTRAGAVDRRSAPGGTGGGCEGPEGWCLLALALLTSCSSLKPSARAFKHTQSIFSDSPAPPGAPPPLPGRRAVTSRAARRLAAPSCHTPLSTPLDLHRPLSWAPGPEPKHLGQDFTAA